MRRHPLTADETEALRRDGYVVRERVLEGADLEALAGACEAMVERLLATNSAAPRIPAGSYLFQADLKHETIIKWEPEHPDALQGVEPFAHFDRALHDWALDPRFADPMRDLLGCDDIELFTEKLNVKRARVGGPIVLHQDYPYWVEIAQDPAEIGTAVIFLDDAHMGNGGLEVLPGSHRAGVNEAGAGAGFARFEMKPDAIDEKDLVSVEVPAGSAVWFGSLLVHRSQPNRSERDRRALLYSYQPAGRPHSIESLRGFLHR